MRQTTKFMTRRTGRGKIAETGQVVLFSIHHHEQLYREDRSYFFSTHNKHTHITTRTLQQVHSFNRSTIDNASPRRTAASTVRVPSGQERLRQSRASTRDRATVHIIARAARMCVPPFRDLTNPRSSQKKKERHLW